MAPSCYKKNLLWIYRFRNLADLSSALVILLIYGKLVLETWG